MAITVNSPNRGTGTEKVSDTSFTITPTSNFTAGRYAFVCAITDNSGTTDGATTTLSVSDSVGGNTWVRDKEETQTAGAALDGCTIGLFRSKLVNAITTTDTITITNTANCTAKGAVCAEVSVGANNTLEVVGSSASGSAASTSYSETVGSLANVEHIFIGIAGAEEELSTAVTRDAAYTSFAQISSGTGGANATNVIATTGYVLETSTTQTFDNSGLTSCDRATLLVAYVEQAAATSFLPTPSTMRQLIRR